MKHKAIIILGLLFLLFFASCAQQEKTTAPKTHTNTAEANVECLSIDACIAVLVSNTTNTSGINQTPCNGGITIGILTEAVTKLKEFERKSIDRLLPLLSHSNCEIRNRVGFAIKQIRYIQPSDEQMLIDAHKKGVVWLEVPIGLTETDTALEYLWLDFLSEPSSYKNDQTIIALRIFNTRLHPRIELEISKCLDDTALAVCTGLVDLAEVLPDFPISALPLFELLAEDPALSELARLEARNRYKDLSASAKN